VSVVRHVHESEGLALFCRGGTSRHLLQPQLLALFRLTAATMPCVGTRALNERRALLHPRCTLDLASEGRIIDKACIGDRGIHRAAVDGARIRGIHRAAADGARIHSIGSRSREGGADSVHQSPYTSQSCSYCHHTQTPAPLAPPLSRACQPIPLRAALDQPRVVG
jgi:hypothetical protein